MQLRIYSIQGRSQREAGWAKTLSWKCFTLLGNGATGGLSQRGQASPYFCYIFLLILVKKTKDFHPKFHVCFFLPDNGENQTKKGLHRKFNAFIRVNFIFR